MVRSFREWMAERVLGESYIPRKRAVAYVLGKLGITSDSNIDPDGKDRQQFNAWMGNQLAGYKDKLVQLGQDPEIAPVVRTNPRLQELIGGRDPDATVNDLVNALSDPAGAADTETPPPVSSGPPDRQDSDAADSLEGPGMGRGYDGQSMREPL